MTEIISNSFPSKYEYTVLDTGAFVLKTRTTYFNEGQLWPIINTRIGYLSIAKNMSTSFVEFLKTQNLLSNHFLFARQTPLEELDNLDNLVAFMRNPFDRYISGLTEYISMKFGLEILTMSDSSIKSIVEALIGITDIDEHSIEQIHFFRDFNLKKFTIFMLDDTFSQSKLFDWMRNKGVIFQNNIELRLPNSNRIKDNMVKLKVYDIVSIICSKNRLFILDNKCHGDNQLLCYFKQNNQIVNDSRINCV